MAIKTPDKSTEFFQKLEAFLKDHGWLLKVGEPEITFHRCVLKNVFGEFFAEDYRLIEESLVIRASGYVTGRHMEEANGTKPDSGEPGVPGD